MSRKKMQKFAEAENFPNLIQLHQKDHKERLQKILSTKKDIILELACGRGEYTLALAQKDSKKNFIGIDIQGERLWNGAKYALENKISNAYFLRIQIEDLEKYFKKKSIQEIWITFPDPYPRKGQIKKRLTSPKFLQIYKNILKKESLLNLKTDDKNLYDYSQTSIKDFGGQLKEKIEDIYSQDNLPDYLKIQTNFEKKHLLAGKKIYYLSFSLK
ncbi:tRNA (guanosine(46)-N7)-methyltransferase TrmB [Patescibacteria group bacterium]|nr:tRNA (guanosine(46)-N7)-methyltransferase TrmB [Patescibacteria group bacterium]